MDGDRVKERRGTELVTVVRHMGGKFGCEFVYPTSNCGETVWAVVGGIHTRNNCKQYLSGTDIACRLFPANMLFTSLKRETVSGCTININADSDKSPRQASL